MSDDFDALVDAFDTMEHHLRIVGSIAAPDMHETLREASVKLLAQILIVLGTITNLQKISRLNLLLRKLAQSKKVASALEELGRLATNHHQTVSAVTLNTVGRTLTALEACNNSVQQDRVESIIDQLTAIALQIDTSIADNRMMLENIQRELLNIFEERRKGWKSRHLLWRKHACQAHRTRHRYVPESPCSTCPSAPGCCARTAFDTQLGTGRRRRRMLGSPRC